MSNKYLSLEDVQQDISYWVVNGLWSFKVKQITETVVVVWCHALRKNLILKKTDTYILRLIKK